MAIFTALIVHVHPARAQSVAPVAQLPASPSTQAPLPATPPATTPATTTPPATTTTPQAPWATGPATNAASAVQAPPSGSVGIPHARIEFVSDDVPVDVYLVVGMRQITEWVTPGPSPAARSAFGPMATSVSPFLLGSTGTMGAFGDQPMPMMVSVERRRFLCRTPCFADLSIGQLQVHMRNRDSTIGTVLLDLPQTGAMYRARTRSVGWYTLGQALLWTGVATLLAGVTLVGQSQSGPCLAGHCGLYEGIGATVGGAVGLSIGIPLILLHSTRIERLR